MPEAQFSNLCYKNKYFNWYFSIIKKAQQRNWNKKNAGIYVEKHHIVPKSIIKNDKTVLLTAKEHFICHLLLPKMLVDRKNIYKMQIALWNMSNTRKEKINSFLYEKLKIGFSKNCSFYMSKENNPMFGKTNKGYKHSEEHKKYMSELFSGKNNPMYGKTQSKTFYDKKCKHYFFCFNKEKIEIYNLKKFCRENNLDQGAMVRVNIGKQRTHKGYSKCPV
jgi:hypothetical protein